MYLQILLDFAPGHVETNSAGEIPNLDNDLIYQVSKSDKFERPNYGIAKTKRL